MCGGVEGGESQADRDTERGVKKVGSHSGAWTRKPLDEDDGDSEIETGCFKNTLVGSLCFRCWGNTAQVLQWDKEKAMTYHY